MAWAEDVFDFGRVPAGRIVEHSFELKNNGPSDWALSKVQMAAGIKLQDPVRALSPGQRGPVKAILDTSAIPDGPYEGQILIYGSATEPFAAFSLRGEIYSPIAIEPKPVVMMVATRGESVSRSVELVNQTATPFEVQDVTHEAGRISTALETLEAGQRYRLDVSMDTSGAAGKRQDRVLITTNHPDAPKLGVVVLSLLRERVYTFPDAVDLGAIRYSDLEKDRSLAERLAQTLMIYRKGATDFAVEAASDIDSLDLAAERGPEGDRYEITVTLNPEKIAPGKINGVIRLSTNDPDFSKVEVPVTGAILDE